MTTKNSLIKITESPRDAMQGLKYLIPVENKARYINALLKVGFNIIDFGSFVSPKAIPQFADIEDLLRRLDPGVNHTELLAIIGNAKWGEVAANWEMIHWFGYPFSISETFQKMNLKRTPEESLETVQQLLDISDKSGKKLRTYLSMAFGNPYGDQWDVHVAAEWVFKLKKLGVQHIAISDTVGVSDPESIFKLFELVFAEFPDMEFGFHLHTSKRKLYNKIQAAWDAGCRNFDTVLTGVGGCPLSGYELVGNLDTLELLSFLEKQNIACQLNKEALEEAVQIAHVVFTPTKI